MILTLLLSTQSMMAQIVDSKSVGDQNGFVDSKANGLGVMIIGTQVGGLTMI